MAESESPTPKLVSASGVDVTRLKSDTAKLAKVRKSETSTQNREDGCCLLPDVTMTDVFQLLFALLVVHNSVVFRFLKKAVSPPVFADRNRQIYLKLRI